MPNSLARRRARIEACNAKRRAQAMKAANDNRKLVQFLPSERAVARWIEQAKKLPLKINY
jgi:hypothetical protein